VAHLGCFFTTDPGTAAAERSNPLAESALSEIPQGSYEVFEPVAGKSLRFEEAFNTIHFYTWGNHQCFLPKGAVAATLVDAWVDEAYDANKDSRARKLAGMKAGDFLLFEEVLGPATGSADDADPLHRQVVRLTSVRRHIDELSEQPVVEIEWDVRDALLFPLCLSTRGPAPQRLHLKHVSVARGNIVLADHGARLASEEVVGVVASDNSPFRPRLKQKWITFRQHSASNVPASEALLQDPRRAVPVITKLTGKADPNSGASQRATVWTAKADLLESGSTDADYMIEVDDDGYANLRFGDGVAGLAPEAASTFHAQYRTGNGAAGNVGAETITRMFVRDKLPGATVIVRNPMAAVGGTDPEPLSEVKLLAPHAFRNKLERAITADDYAALAEQHPKVQRAAAVLLWNGNRYLVRVAIDPLGTEQPTQEFLGEIRRYLSPYRRIGHDIEVRAASYVSLDLAIQVWVLPDYIQGHVKAAVLDALSNRTLPDGTTGFFYPDNLTFGDSIFLSRLIAAVQAITGVETVEITRLQRLYDGPMSELENGVLPIGPMEVARLDNDPNKPEDGILRLTMEGGR
jgi:Baseplate J-like protein